MIDFGWIGASSNKPHLQKEIVGDATYPNGTPHPFVLDIDNDKKYWIFEEMNFG